MMATLIILAIIGLFFTLLAGGVAMIVGFIRLAVGGAFALVTWAITGLAAIFLAGWICGLTGKAAGCLKEAWRQTQLPHVAKVKMPK